MAVSNPAIATDLYGEQYTSDWMGDLQYAAVSP